jgi:hypothetical protein
MCPEQGVNHVTGIHPKKMARDVQDARVPRSAWMRESGPDGIDSNRLMAILAPLGSLRRPIAARLVIRACGPPPLRRTHYVRASVGSLRAPRCERSPAFGVRYFDGK